VQKLEIKSLINNNINKEVLGAHLYYWPKIDNIK
jgi:hypothetical protein